MRYLLLVLVVGLSACKQAAPTSTALDSGSSGGASGVLKLCDCGNQACWQQATTNATYDQLKCARDAMEHVMPIVGPAADLVRELAAADTDELKALASGASIAGELAEAFNKRQGISKELSCASAIVSTVKNLMTALRKVEPASKVFTESPSLEGLRELGNLVIAARDAATTASELLTESKVRDCNTQMTKAGVAEYNEKLKKVADGPQKFVQSFLNKTKDITKDRVAKLNVARTILGCAVKIGNGLVVLGGNIDCAIKDITNLMSQKEKIDQGIAAQAGKANRPGNADLCNGQPRWNNEYMMNAFGSHLNATKAKDLREGTIVGDTSNRADFCAAKCSDKAACDEYMAHREGVIGEPTPEGCKGFCAATQYTANALNACHAACCGNSDATNCVAETIKLTAKSQYPNVVWPTAMVKEGDFVASGTGIWAGANLTYLAMQNDGNLVLYKNGDALWNSGTHGRREELGFPQDYGLYLKNGNLSVATTSKYYFQTHTTGANCALEVLDGAVVLKCDGEEKWRKP